MKTRDHYQLTRTTIIDHAGTDFSVTLVTSSRSVLNEAVRESIRGGHFCEDSFSFAWEDTILRGTNEISQVYLPSLRTTVGGRVSTMTLIPDMVIERGDARIRLEVVRTKRAARIKVFDGTGSEIGKHASLAALGEDVSVLAPLRGADGPVRVELLEASLLEAIPELGEHRLQEPLVFPPSKSPEFRAFLEHELEPEFLTLLPGEANWDGCIPLDRWFPSDELMRAWEDAGYAETDAS